MNEEYYQNLISDPNTKEAGKWLNENSLKDRRNIGEMNFDESDAFIKKLYSIGAELVYAIKLKKNFLGKGESTNALIVKLSNAESSRKALFLEENNHARKMGFDVINDTNQSFITFYWS